MKLVTASKGTDCPWIFIESPLRLSPVAPPLRAASRRPMFVDWTVAVEMATFPITLNVFKPAVAA
jgi:hypothetical protein